MSVAKNLFKRHIYASTDSLSRKIMEVTNCLSHSDMNLDEKNFVLTKLKDMIDDIAAIHATIYDFNM